MAPDPAVRPDPLPRHGSGFVLRRFAPTDLRAFQAYRGDAGLGRYQGWSPMSDADATRFISAMAAAPVPTPGDWVQIAIAAPADDALIGDIGIRLDADGREAEVGFTLARAAQGRGIAGAAVGAAIALVFGHSAAARVIAITDARNRASIRLLERIGMRRTGSREAVFRGEPCIEHSYAISPEETRR